MRTRADATRRSARRARAGRPRPGSSTPVRGRPALEQDEPDAPAARLLVAPQRRPRALAVDARPAAAASTSLDRRRSAGRRGGAPRSRPSATASPCGSVVAGAASSACANVWPRLSTARRPRSRGSRRQTAALYAAQRRTSSGSGSSQSGSPASRPVFTTSARPLAPLALAAASRAAPGRSTVRAGQWNAPTRFLPSGRSIAVLPPIAASTWPTSVVGTATHGIAAQVRRRDEAGDVGRAAAAERDERAVAVEPQLAPEPLARRRASSPPRRPAARACDASRAPSASCAAAPWMPATCASATSATGPSPGTSSPSSSSAPSSTWTPPRRARRRRTSRARASATSRVERPRAPRRGGGTASRPARAAGSGRATRRQASSTSTSSSTVKRALAQRLAARARRRPRRRRARSPPGSGSASASTRELLLGLAELVLAALGEELAGSARRRVARSRASRSTNGRPSRRATSRAERRLAGAHEADRGARRSARAVGLTVAGCQSIRSRYARWAATKSPSASPPNFSRAARASSQATAASATTASASTAATSERSTSASAGSPRREVDRAQRPHQRRQRLHRGADDDLLAVRDAGLDARRRGSSRGGARRRRGDLVVRLRAALGRASAKPSPISTPLTAWMPITARREPRVEAVLLASRTSRARAARRVARTSTTPPTVSRSARAASTGRAHRLLPARAAEPRDARRPRFRSRSSAFATAPAATCTAVWRALARSSASRTSSRPYLSTPARSAWPGRGSVTGLRALPVRLALGRPRAHPPRPVLVVAVADDERERRPERAPVAQARRAPRPRPSRSAGAGCGRSPAGGGAGRRRSPSRSSTRPGRQAGEDRDERRARATRRR